MTNTKSPYFLRSGGGLLFAFILFTVPAIARGHAFPDHAEPRVGSTVETAPERVRIWFDSALKPAFCRIVVQDASGKRVDKGDGRVNASDPKLIEVSVPFLPVGTYRVIWSVVTRDEHRTSGEYKFAIKRQGR